MCAKLQTKSYCKSILTIITLIIPLLTSSTNEPTSNCDGLMLATTTNNIQFYPTNVCSVHYDAQKDTQLSTMFQCTQDGSDITMNIWPNTDCAGNMIADHDLYDNIINNNYSIFCTGVPCNYGIVRYYPISNCNASIDEYNNNKYWDKIIIINDSFTDTIYTKCNDGSSIEGESESIIDGSCNEQKFISKIICGNAQSEIISDSKPSLELLVLVTVSIVAFLGSLCFIFCFIHKNYSSRLHKKISRMKSTTENTSPMAETDNFKETIDLYDDDDTSAQTANQV
eukprot:42324_1